MDILFSLIGFGATIAAATMFLVLRGRRARRLPGDDDASLYGELSHNEAMNAARTAGISSVRYAQNNGVQP